MVPLLLYSAIPASIMPGTLPSTKPGLDWVTNERIWGHELIFGILTSPSWPPPLPDLPQPSWLLPDSQLQGDQEGVLEGWEKSGPGSSWVRLGGVWVRWGWALGMAGNFLMFLSSKWSDICHCLTSNKLVCKVKPGYYACPPHVFSKENGPPSWRFTWWSRIYPGHVCLLCCPPP